mgnify:CR=1 FL=1
MKKAILIILTCVFSVVLLCGTLTACGDDDLSNDPIIGTWLCDDEDSYYAYYVEITVPQSDDEPDFMLNFKMYAAAPDKDELVDWNRPFQLSIDQNTEGKYRLFATFIPEVAKDSYEVEMQGNDGFVATGDEGIYRSGRHEFKRTSLTLEQFEAQYLNK